MLPAVAYPALSFVGQWGIGGPLVLADAELAPPGEWPALAFFWLWLGGASAILVLSTVKSRGRLPLFVLALGILLGGVFLADRVGVPAEAAFAAAAAAAAALDILQVRRGRHPALWLGYLLALLVALTATVLLVDRIGESPDGVPGDYIVLFLGVFPILNAAADFASIGLTRHLLRHGLEGRTWVNALKDFAGGAAIFATLGCALITWVHLVRPGDGTPLLDLAALFAALETSPGDHWWLFVMLFSTVLPTLLHAMVGLYTLLLHYPAWLRGRLVALLVAGGKGSDTKGWWGSVIYCGMLTLSVWVPLWATWAFFTFDHARVLDWIVAGFRWYAALIGAI